MGNSPCIPRIAWACLGFIIPALVQGQSLELSPAESGHLDVPIVLPSIEADLGGTSLLDSDPIGNEKSGSQWADSSAEKVQQRFPNGKLHIQRSIVEDEEGNFINHGDYVEYDTKGELIRSGTFLHGKLDGQWKQVLGVEAMRQLTDNVDSGFHPPFHSHTTFVDGKISDAWTVSDSKGKLVFILQIENGKRENLSIWYNSRGDVVRELMYSANVPNGSAVMVDPKTKKPTPITLDEGRIVQTKTEWHDSQTGKKKKSEGSVLVPYAFTIEDHDWWNSRIKMVPVKSAEPIRHGLVSNWYANGQLAFHGNYTNGKLDGESTWYYENGQPMGRGMNKNNVKVGEWTWWHPNGMKQASGHYEGGIATGVWSTWGPDGQLKQRGDAQTLLASGEDFGQPMQRETKPVPLHWAKRVDLRPSTVRRASLR